MLSAACLLFKEEVKVLFFPRGYPADAESFIEETLAFLLHCFAMAPSS